MRLRWIGLFCALAAFVPSAQAEMRRPAGYVVAVEAPEGAPAALVRREGQPIAAQVWTPLFDGDAVEVAGPTVVVIETAKDKRLAIDAARSPHRVEGEMGGRFAALAARLGDLFRAKPEATPANLVGRADPPPRFAFGQGHQSVAPGQPIWIAWRGGTAPFTLDLVGQSGARKQDLRPLAGVRVATRQARLDVPARAKGRLSLVLRDAEGREARIAVTSGPAPRSPDWVREGAPTPQTARLAEAVDLLDRKPARFDLYAAGLLASLDDAPARAMLARLARGARTP